MERLVQGNKAAGASYGFSRGHELNEKTKKWTTCHLMPHNKHLGE
jgi:hypothetical protein